MLRLEDVFKISNRDSPLLFTVFIISDILCIIHARIVNNILSRSFEMKTLTPNYCIFLGFFKYIRDIREKMWYNGRDKELSRLFYAR